MGLFVSGLYDGRKYFFSGHDFSPARRAGEGNSLIAATAKSGDDLPHQTNRPIGRRDKYLIGHRLPIVSPPRWIVCVLNDH